MMIFFICPIFSYLGYHKVPESNKKTAASFSMGSIPKAHYETVGPGPAQYDVTGLSAKGKMIPRESTMGIRPEPLKKYKTPGPGDYDVENMGKSKLMSSGVTRGFTFGHPNLHAKTSSTPGIFANNTKKGHFGSITFSASVANG